VKFKQFVEERGVDNLPDDGVDSDGCRYDLSEWGSPTSSKGITLED
jgi:hypothetical protein